MAAASDTSFANAIRLEFEKRLRNEPQTGGRDFLKDIFSRRPLKEKEAMYDIVDTVTSSTLDTSTSSGRRPTTVAGQVPKYRRRQTAFVADNLKVNINRLDAKYLGRSVREHATKCMDLYMNEKMRRWTTLTLARLTATYKENPAVGSQTTAATDAAFPVTQEFFPQYRASASNYHGQPYVAKSAPLTLDSWHQLVAIHDDELGSNISGEGTVDGVLGNFKRVAIFTNAGWEVFVRTNNGLAGNRDYFGKATYLEGYGKIRMIGDTAIVVLPNTFIPKVTSSASTETALAATDATDPINRGVTGTAAAADITTVNGYQMFFVYPDALDFRLPEQYNMTSPELYMEQANSLEYALYGFWALEATRLFDKLVSRVTFWDPNQAITVKS